MAKRFWIKLVKVLPDAYHSEWLLDQEGRIKEYEDEDFAAGFAQELEDTLNREEDAQPFRVYVEDSALWSGDEF